MKLNEPAQDCLVESGEIAKQVEVELALLLHIEEALRIALAWRSSGRENIRKLSTLRFVLRTFERHLARLRVLSEYGGYMYVVSQTKPHLAGSVKSLKNLRDDLQSHLESMMLKLEHVSPQNTHSIAEICTELEKYLDDLSSHGKQEIDLLQKTFGQEEGGSG